MSSVSYQHTTVTVADKMQRGYQYTRSQPEGKWPDFPKFKPKFSPQQMLQMGVFEGKYCRDCHAEFPKSWWVGAQEAKGPDADVGLNYFKIKSRLSLQEWRKRGWIPIAPGDPDVRGWFQWYMRFFSGRRDPRVDAIQVGRWSKIARHYAQVVKNCKHKDKTGRCTDPKKCRPRQRQALLQWSWPCLD